VRTKRRSPIAYAAVLIVALVAAGGAAAYSNGRAATPADAATTSTAATLTTSAPVSARVASAIFALSVSRKPPTVGTTTTVAAFEVAPAPQIEVAPSTTDPTPATTTTATTGTTEPKDRTPPKITVTSPRDGDIVTSDLVTFKGETEPGAKVFSGPFEADVDDTGHWSIKLVVTEGPNGAVFFARDAAGNEASVRIVVHYEPPTTTTRPRSTTTTTHPPSGSTTTTTTAPPTDQWSPNWPADAAGKRNVENWRATVVRYWDEDKVDCALGLIYRESRGDPQAHNRSTGAVGLFQHLLKYWPGRAGAAGFVDGDGRYADPYNGEANIAASAWLAGYYESRGLDWWKPWGSAPSYGTCQP